MNIILKSLLLTLVIVLTYFTAKSQDKIYKKNKEVLECTIKEVGSEDIKYYTTEVPEGVLLSIPVDKVSKIIFSNGKLITFKDNFSDPENYADQHRNLIKMNFLEPLSGSTSFTYERNLQPGRSIEGTLGIIGLGWDLAESQGGGAYVGFGIKFLSKPDYYFRRMRYAHILKGFYVKPELILSSYKVIPFENYNYKSNPNVSSITNEKVSVFTGVILINIGKQWIFNDLFALDLYGSVGYGHKSRAGVQQYGIFVGDEVPLAGKVGLRIGFLY